MTSPAELFQGYSNVDCRGLSTAIKGTFVKTGGTSSVVYSVCEDIESLCAALGISQSALIDLGPLISANNKFTFVKKLKLNAYSISIVVRARHIREIKTATEYKLKDDIEPPIGNDELRSFFRRYGDSFISTMTMGSEYYAVYSFNSQSKEQQMTISASLRAKGFCSSANITAGFQAKIDNIKKYKKVEVVFCQNISGISNPQLPAESALVEFATNFMQIPIDLPAVISYDSTGYEHVLNGENFGQIARNRQYFVGGHAVDGLAADLGKLNNLLSGINNLRSIYDFYGYTRDITLSNARIQVDDDINAINGQVRTFLEEPLSNFTRPQLKSLNLGHPQLHYVIGNSPIHGYNGGNPFNDVDVTSYLQQRTRISTIQISTKQLETDIGLLQDFHHSLAGADEIDFGQINDSPSLIGTSETDISLRNDHQSLIGAGEIDIDQHNDRRSSIGRGETDIRLYSSLYAIHNSLRRGMIMFDYITFRIAMAPIIAPRALIRWINENRNLPRLMRTSVSQLTVRYDSICGEPRTVIHGRGGSPGNTLQLLPGQFVIEMSGCSSFEVNKLSFKLSDNREISGGEGFGRPFFWRVPEDAIVLGFSGRSDSSLDQICAVYAELQDAKWVQN